MSHHGATYTKLEYHRRRFSFTKTVLLDTIHPQTESFHVNGQQINFLHAHLTIKHHPPQAGVRHCILIGTRGRDQLEICRRSATETKIFFTNVISTVAGPHIKFESLQRQVSGQDSMPTSSIYSQRQNGDDLKRGYAVCGSRVFYRLWNLPSHLRRRQKKGEGIL